MSSDQMDLSGEQQKKELVECIHFLHARGWAPATSSNYSFRSGILPGQISISSSGIDKGNFVLADLMIVDLNGQPVNDERKPSAETLLHTLIYQKRAEVNCVLHTHTVYNTILSRKFLKTGKLILEGYEMLKGFHDIHTHESSIEIPIFENSQDMLFLAEHIQQYWARHPEMRVFLLAGHGMYTWGRSIAEAKRHVEVVEFLLECYYREKFGMGDG
jgi:methylthioribulose-1-phosphate dehydratase